MTEEDLSDMGDEEFYEAELISQFPYAGTGEFKTLFSWIRPYLKSKGFGIRLAEENFVQFVHPWLDICRVSLNFRRKEDKGWYVHALFHFSPLRELGGYVLPTPIQAYNAMLTCTLFHATISQVLDLHPLPKAVIGEI